MVKENINDNNKNNNNKNYDINNNNNNKFRSSERNVKILRKKHGLVNWICI